MTNRSDDVERAIKTRRISLVLRVQRAHAQLDGVDVAEDRAHTDALIDREAGGIVQDVALGDEAILGVRVCVPTWVERRELPRLPVAPPKIVADEGVGEALRLILGFVARGARSTWRQGRHEGECGEAGRCRSVK